MRCTPIKDKLTKSFIDQGAINPGNNKILDIEIFKQLNTQYSDKIREDLGYENDSEVFHIVDGIAKPNVEYLASIDRALNPTLVYEERAKQEASYDDATKMALASTERIADTLQNDATVRFKGVGENTELDIIKTGDGRYFRFLEAQDLTEIDSKELDDMLSKGWVEIATTAEKDHFVNDYVTGLADYEQIESNPLLSKEERDTIKESILKAHRNIDQKSKATELLKILTNRKIEQNNARIYNLIPGFETVSRNTLSFLSDPDQDSVAVTEQKIERMKEVFDAEVVIDTDLDVSGVLLSADHPLSVRSGRPVIAINPNLLFADTVFHEFGHLYIDLLGGLKDPVVASAVESLKGSQLWNEIAETYSELQDENLAKEVLATALGVKGNNIFNAPEKESVWQQIKNALLKAIDAIFGSNLGNNAIEQLASEMLSGNIRTNPGVKFNTLMDQRRKLYIKDADINQDSIDSLFTHISKKFKLKESDHTYSDQDTGEVFRNSMSSYAKAMMPGRGTYLNGKGSRDIAFTAIHHLTEYSYENSFFEPKIPYALDRALDDFFKGRIEGSTMIYANDDNNKYWFTYYKELLNKEIIKDRIPGIIRENIELINKQAETYEKERTIPALAGTEVHEAIEAYIRKRTPFPPHIMDNSGELFTTIKGIIEKGEAEGSKFYPEQILFSDSAQKPGTADLIEITKDGKYRIYDFKTRNTFTDSNDDPLSDYIMYILPGYLNQLVIYSTVLEEYNLKPADNHLNVISIEVNNENFDPDSDESMISITGVINKNIDPKHKNFNNKYLDARRKVLSEFRNPKKLKDLNLKTKEQQVEQLVLKIQRGLEDYRGLTNAYSGKANIDRLADSTAIYAFEEEITELMGKNNGLIIYKYIDNMRNALFNVYNNSHDNDAIITSNYLMSVDYLLQASDFISDIKNFVQHTPQDYTLNDLDRDELVILLDETTQKVNEVRELFVTKSKQMAINTLVTNSNFMEGFMTEKLEIEARAAGHKTKDAINSYIYDKLRNDVQVRETIENKEYDYWERAMIDGYTDIRYMEYLLADPGMNKSQFVQVVKNMLDKVDNDIRIDIDNTIPDIVSWYDKIKSKQLFGNPKKMWEDVLEEAHYMSFDEKDEAGKPKEIRFTHGSVIPEFTSAYREEHLKFKYKLEYLKRELDKAFRSKNEKRQEVLKAEIKRIRELRKKALKNKSTERTVHPRFAALSPERQEELRFIHKQLEEGDEKAFGAGGKKLVGTVRKQDSEDFTKIYHLPKMRMSTIEASHDAKGTWNRFKSGLEDMIRPPSDEDELSVSNAERDGGDITTRGTDILGNPSYTVPLYYRNDLEDPTLQSFDIPTLLAANAETTIAYHHHKMIEADLHMITTALKNTKSIKTDAVVSKNITDSVNGKLPKSLQSSDNLVLKAVEASINNRFYKRSYAGAYSKGHYRAIKLGESLGAVTSALLLSGNFRSSSMTGIQGSIYRMVEGVAGENFNKKDVAIGSKKAWGDITALLKDTQEHFPKSKTNLLIRRFGLETQFKALTNKFIQDNAITKNLDGSAVYAITSMAETMVTASLMYTLMNNIKVMNDTGDYINKNGDVVPKEEAMTLDEAYEVVDGKLVLDQNVTYTERNLHNKFNDEHAGEKTIASTEISRYIRSIYADLYGQYNQDMKSVAEMHVVGKLVMSMRKWIPRGYHRRWRGILSAKEFTFSDLRDEANIDRRFYSQDQKRFQEGYYTTGVRYVTSLIHEMKEKNLAWASQTKEGMTGVYATMTSHERANLKRLGMELGVIALSAASALFIGAAVKALDDDDEDRSLDKLYFLLYLLERIKVESQTFINPFELADNIRNPAAAMNTLSRIQQLLTQMFDFEYSEEEGWDFAINDRYERGPRKGELKVSKGIQHLLPVVKNANQFMGIFGMDSKDSVKDSYEFLK